MTDQTTAAQADNKEIRSGFELCYAVDADAPANVSDLGHFTNGWRACIMYQVRAEGVLASANAPQPVGYIALGCEVALPRCRSAKENTTSTIMAQPEGIHTVPVFAKPVASAPVANAMPIRLSKEVLEYLKEGIENATGCEDSDVDHDFANELERLMTGPLYTKPVANYPEVEWAPMVVAPVAGEAQKRVEQLRKAVATFLNAYRARYGGIYGQIKKQAPLQDEVLGLVFASREAPPSDDAAPPASEAVRTQVLAALESAQRFIRNGVEFGYVSMPEADTSDPAHRTPGLIDAAIRALSAQPGSQNEGSGLCLNTQRPAS